MIEAIDHTVTREIANGIWTMIGLFLIVGLTYTLVQDMRHRPGWRFDRGTQLVIGSLVYFIGSIDRSTYIWLSFIWQNRGWDTENISEAHWLLIVAAAFAIIGGLCILRICIVERFGDLAWITAGVVSVAVPVAVYWWV
jgi:hypothetical protein